jgi:hypothetical protein
MKDRVITEIQTAMSSLLTPSQLIELRRVLTNCLHHVETYTPDQDG